MGEGILCFCCGAELVCDVAQPPEEWSEVTYAWSAWQYEHLLEVLARLGGRNAHVLLDYAQSFRGPLADASVYSLEDLYLLTMEWFEEGSVAAVLQARMRAGVRHRESYLMPCRWLRLHEALQEGVGAVDAVEEATRLITVFQCLGLLRGLHERERLTLERELADEVCCTLGRLTTDGRYDDRAVFNWEDLEVDYIVPQRYAQDPVWLAGRVPGLFGMAARVVVELVYGRVAQAAAWACDRGRVARVVAKRV